jgi:hypothetical protein
LDIGWCWADNCGAVAVAAGRRSLGVLDVNKRQGFPCFINKTFILSY